MSLYPIFSICLIFLATQVYSDDPVAGVQNALVKLDDLEHQPARYDDYWNMFNYISYIVGQIQANPLIFTKVINERNINTTVDAYGRAFQLPYTLLRTKCAMPILKKFYGPLMQTLAPLIQAAMGPIKGILQPLLRQWGPLLDLAIMLSGPLSLIGGVGGLATGLLGPALGGVGGILANAASGNLAGIASSAAGTVTGLGGTVLGAAAGAPGAAVGAAAKTLTGAVSIAGNLATGNVLGAAGDVANTLGGVANALTSWIPG